MKIATARPIEAFARIGYQDVIRRHNADEGYHNFHDENGEHFGSFRVFYHEGGHLIEPEEGDDMPLDEPIGWYWIGEWPGCLPDGEPEGPFFSSTQARQDADENLPEDL